MSIVPFLQTHIANSTLEKFDAPKGQTARRGLLLAPEAQKALKDPNSPIVVLGYRPQTLVMMEKWVTEGVMPSRLGGKAREAHLARLDPPPPEVWEFRITEPARSQVRVFGRFARPNLFVATHIISRHLLGKVGSSVWRNALRDCVSAWEALFPGVSPHSGTSLHEYVTQNSYLVGPDVLPARR